AGNQSLAGGDGVAVRERRRVLRVLQGFDGSGEKEVKPRIWPFAAASSAACALGLGLSVPFGPPAVYGAVAASLGAVCALSALVMSIDRGVNGVFLGFTVGFLCRAVLVGAGLTPSGTRRGRAAAYGIAICAQCAGPPIAGVRSGRAH